MLDFTHVLRGGIFWAILVNLVAAGKLLTSFFAWGSEKMLDISLYLCIGYDIGAVALCLNLFYWFTTADSNAVLAGKLMKYGIHPRLLNISGLLPPASSSPFDSLSTQLPQAPADYCGLCIIEAPGGIRLVYWVCLFIFLMNHLSIARHLST